MDTKYMDVLWSRKYSDIDWLHLEYRSVEVGGDESLEYEKHCWLQPKFKKID